METEKNVNEEVETEETQVLDGEVCDSEEDAATSTDEKHSGLGLAAGIAIVAVGAAALAGGKKLVGKLKSKRKDKKTDDIVAGTEPPKYVKLSLKERLTGKIQVDTEEVENED